MGRRLPPLFLVVVLSRQHLSLAHLEPDLVDFVIRVRIESKWDGGWGWSIQYGCLSAIISLL